MEPSASNQWQPVAKSKGRENGSNRPIPDGGQPTGSRFAAHGKEGLDGSNPSKCSAKVTAFADRREPAANPPCAAVSKARPGGSRSGNFSKWLNKAGFRSSLGDPLCTRG